MTRPQDDPFRHAAEAYFERGWYPFPLPLGAKSNPPTGITGWNGVPPTLPQIREWMKAGPQNIGVVLPPSMVGLDVDDYVKGEVVKRGGETLAKLAMSFGDDLPATWFSTSRGTEDEPGISGIHFLRVPEGMVFVDKADAVDLIQHSHRYAVVWPSVVEGREYRWFDNGERTTNDLDGIPEADGIDAALPFTWQAGLEIKGKKGISCAALPAEVAEFIAVNVERRNPRGLANIVTKLDARPPGESRHDTLVATAPWALREAAAGWYTTTEAIGALRSWWVAVMDDPTRLGWEFE